MTEQYILQYDDKYVITFEWWGGDITFDKNLIRTMSVYLYDNTGELILEDRNIVLLYLNIEYRNDLSNIKIHRDISVLGNNYFVFSLFIYDFIKNRIKAIGFKDLKNCLLYYDREVKIKELLK